LSYQCPLYKPLDKDLIIKSALKNPRLITLEDGCLSGGFCSAVIEMLNDENIKADILRCELMMNSSNMAKQNFI
jgi:deoxyxylulose-5-phosphate synthase